MSDLRPWEYMAMDSADLYLVNALRAAYEEGKQEARDESDQAASAP